MKKQKWEQVGLIGVDAGLCWLGDPCYIIHPDKIPDALGKDWGEFCAAITDVDNKQFNYDMGHPGLGVCVSTGWGDGVYPVEVLREGEEGRIAEVRVRFIIDEEEDHAL